MKINYIGVVAGIIAFISLALPWWAFTASAEAMGVTVNTDLLVYLYQATASTMGISATVTMELWFGWAALAFIVVAGIAGLVGSVIVGKNGKRILIIAGILALFAIIIFAVGLQDELSKAPPVSGFPELGLFSSGSWRFMGVSMDYSALPSFGFWLALVSAVITFISLVKHPVTPQETPPTP